MLHHLRLFLVALSLLAFASTISSGESPSLSLHRNLQNETTPVGEDDHDHDHDHDHDDGTLLEDATATTSKPWGEAILASFIINIVTLVGVFFLSGEFVAKRVFKRDTSKSPYYLAFTRNVIPSFACGALLATTVFLVLPEALHLISAQFMGDEYGHHFLEEADHDDNGESQATWRFGACIIAGFLLPILTDSLFPHTNESIGQVEKKQELNSSPHSPAVRKTEKQDDTPVDDDSICEESPPSDNPSSSDNKAICDNTNKSVVSEEDDSDLIVVVADKILPHSIDCSLTVSIFAGDFFHNFADGIFVGTAFLLCSRDFAIAVSAATVYHEIAQEIADYFMLTRFCNIRPVYALLLNFINGMSVMLGACMILGIEDMSDVAIGCILAISSGVYLNISIAECFPRAKQAQQTPKDKLVGFASFVIGVVPIGLVLLNHGHCEEHAH